jgi:hypothetical protein
MLGTQPRIGDAGFFSMTALFDSEHDGLLCGLGAGNERHCDDHNIDFGSFENRHREQDVLRIDRKTRNGTLWCSDVDWGSSYPIQNGQLPGDLIF